MIVTIGEYALAGTLLVAVAVIVATIAHIRLGLEAALRAACWGMGLIAVLLSVSAWALLKSLIDNNFGLSYVAEHSERALPLGYKIAAFWAGQEGSLLFWAWVLGVMGLILAVALRKRETNEAAISLAVMAGVTGFFALLMLYAGNPFEAATVRVADGHGLNPMLQNFAMVFHPPLLFLGYAGFTVPFAILVAALLTGREDRGWLEDLRPWVIASWLFLSVGIVLGAQWAYVELGWGGYWAWDPVENASLLPWLTATALLHSIAVFRRRGMFKRWTAFLTAGTFLLCIFGTYLTRSGVIQSVHSFGESPIGTFFLVFMAILTVGSLVLIVARLGLLSGEHALDAMLSREGVFLSANVLLVAMTVVTLVGTIFPILSGAFGGQGVTVSGPFYNKVVLPMAVVLAGLMATGPILGYGEASARAKKLLGYMIGAGVIGAILVAVSGHLAIWALATGAVAAGVLAGVAIDFGTTIWQASEGSNVVIAVIRVLRGTPHRWGAQTAHIGLAAVIVGVAGSSLYNVNETVALKSNETATIGGYTVAYRSLEETRRSNHMAAVATVDVTAKDGSKYTLRPERRFYDKSMEQGQSASEVAIRFGLGGDVYMNLAGWEEGAQTITLQVIVNPLVDWIWIGGGLMTLGGMMCLLPQRKARQAEVVATATAPGRMENSENRPAAI